MKFDTSRIRSISPEEWDRERDPTRDERQAEKARACGNSFTVVRDWLLRAKIGLTEKILYELLYRREIKGQRDQLTIPHLARDLGLSYSQIVRARLKLKSVGLIVWSKRRYAFPDHDWMTARRPSVQVAAARKRERLRKRRQRELKTH